MNCSNSKFEREPQSNADVDGVDELPPPPDGNSNYSANGMCIGSGGEDDNASSTISPTTTTNGSSIGLSHVQNANLSQPCSGQRLLISPRPQPRKNGGCLPHNPDVQVKTIFYNFYVIIIGTHN